MGIFRTSEEHKLRLYNGGSDGWEFKDEWKGEDLTRLDEPSWQHRYDYEATILENIINENKFNNIIELGSGPGEMAQKIMKKHTNKLDYTLIDQPGAKTAFDNKQYKGNFYVKDMLNDLDVTDLRDNYDFLITNDFLEHIYNPSLIVQKCHTIIKPEGKMFVSVPNWRMGHKFVYRGLFDYDNFIYFMYTHGFKISGIFDSPLKCAKFPKIDSEQEMDDRLLDSWNWYMLFDKIK